MNTIVLVDDNEDNRIIYRTILEHAGYRVLECGDGRSALECVRAESPDLVLMDLAMPGLDGWEVTHLLKADPETSGIPILALTARAQADDVARGQEAGFEAYLTKPIEPTQVLQTVQRVLGNSQTSRSGARAGEATTLRKLSTRAGWSSDWRSRSGAVVHRSMGWLSGWPAAPDAQSCHSNHSEIREPRSPRGADTSTAAEQFGNSACI